MVGRPGKDQSRVRADIGNGSKIGTLGKLSGQKVKPIETQLRYVKISRTNNAQKLFWVCVII